MRAVSLNVKEKKDIIWYEVKWQKNPKGEELQCKSAEFPRPELMNTLEAFAEFIPCICLIHKNSIRQVIITGATFAYGETKTCLSLGAYIDLFNGFTLKMKLPSINVDMEQDINACNSWEDRFSGLAKMLNDEILLYAQGKRAQTELEFDGDEETDEY